MHAKKVPHPISLKSKKEAQDKLLKQCQAIWQAADSLSQADTASSSESRRGSPLMTPSQPPKGKHIRTDFSQKISTGFFFLRRLCFQCGDDIDRSATHQAREQARRAAVTQRRREAAGRHQDDP